MSEITCPHCGTMNPAGSSFCESCGKALPTSASAGPRVVGEGSIASTSAGQNLQAQELKKKMKSARGALLAVAIIQVVVGFILYAALAGEAGKPNSLMTQADLNIMLVVILVIGAIYFGLWAWAKSAPFPAALTGLILYITIWFAEILMDPAAILQGILIKIIIIAVLVKAVQAGLEYRKLLDQAGGRVG